MSGSYDPDNGLYYSSAKYAHVRRKLSKGYKIAKTNKIQGVF